MTDAVFSQPASSAEYNKVTANVRDLDTRAKNLEAVTTNSTTGNTALGNRISTVETKANTVDTRTTDTTSGNAALNTRLGTVETNIGTRGSNGTVYAEITAVKSQVLAFAKPTTASDTALYGDVISSHTRAECWWGEAIGNGFLTVQATRSPKTFTATDLRFCVPTAAGGTGTFDLKLYTGTALTNLTERAAISGPGLVTTAGVKHQAINLAISEGDYIAIAILCTGFNPSPKFSSTATSSGAQLLIADGSAYSVFKSGQAAPIPSTINTLDAGWTRANQQFWFALA
ncbi:hypothetical protein [Actinocrispum wychmicini]|nr:hypothetical protein [Actinocrispum wychmicini]